MADHPADRGNVVTLPVGAAHHVAVARGMESACWPSPVEGEGAAVILGFAHPVFGWVYFAIDVASCALLAGDLTAFSNG